MLDPWLRDHDVLISGGVFGWKKRKQQKILRQEKSALISMVLPPLFVPAIFEFQPGNTIATVPQFSRGSGMESKPAMLSSRAPVITAKPA